MFDSIPRGAANAARFADSDARNSSSQADGALRQWQGLAGLYWLKAALAEIDYGVLLLDEDGRVVHANPVAHAQMCGDHPLQLTPDRLRARDPRDASVLQAAIEGAARRGLRKLISLRASADDLVSLSVIPLAGICEPGSAASGEAAPRQAVLVLLGKRRLGGELAIESFARLHGLSAGETRVLLALNAGLQPTELARRHGVAIATVRTQIGSIRAKTGAGSIRGLLRQLTLLPPLQGILHREPGPALQGGAVNVRVVRMPA
ncbi:MAG: helix-turn-helix transcriptional regulator [Ideonella sp.]